MAIDELLNQKPKLELPGGRRTIDSVTLKLCLTDSAPYPIGVTTQQEKDLLEGYLIVLGKNNRVYLADSYMYG